MFDILISELKNLMDKAERLKKLYEIANDDRPSAKDVASLASRIIKSVQGLQTELNRKIDSNDVSHKQAVKTLEMALHRQVEELRKEMSKVGKDTQDKAYKTLSNEVYKLEKTIKELPQLNISQLEAKFTAVIDNLMAEFEAINPLTPVEIRNALESLNGDEKLDASAIKGLDKHNKKVSDDILDRAVAIVDQRSSYLVQKVANLQTQVDAGSGATTPTAITVANEAADTTCFPLFATAATGDLGPKSNAGLTFDASTSRLTATGGLGAGTGGITNTGALSTSLSRTSKVWATDVESTNMPTVGGTAILTSLTAPQFTTVEIGHASDTTLARASAGVASIEGNNIVVNTSSPTLATITTTANIELGHASDTTLSRSSAGVLAVEGVVIPSISSTNTLTNKRVTKRAPAVTQSATPAINTDVTDVAHITALAQAITSMTSSLTGTPVEGDTLRIDITDNGTARGITWGASFEASTVALPTTTVISTRLDVGFVWNSVTSKWRCVAVA